MTSRGVSLGQLILKSPSFALQIRSSTTVLLASLREHVNAPYETLPSSAGSTEDSVRSSLSWISASHEWKLEVLISVEGNVPCLDIAYLGEAVGHTMRVAKVNAERISITGSHR